MHFSRLIATCPHCFRQINLMRGVFRCSLDSCTTRRDVTLRLADGSRKVPAGETLKQGKDPRLEAVWEDANLYPHTFETVGMTPPVPFLGSIRKRARCPASQEPTTNRVCPNCHKSLYSRFGEGSDRRLTLIGAKNAGKSNYIAVLVQELANKIGGRFGFAMQRMDQHTSDVYDSRYYGPVYRLGQRVEGTDRVRRRQDAIAPLVFGLNSISGNNLATISLFDPPGEGVINERNVERFHHFVFNSHGLVLLVDGEKLVTGGGHGDEFREATTVLEVAVRQLEADRTWRRRLRPYLAITVSKADMLRGLSDLPAEILKAPSYDHDFDEAGYRRVSSEVETLIRRRGGGNFCRIAKAAFGPDHVGFFLVSSFGSNPDPRTGRIPVLDPLRVVDPFLWLMTRTGIIESQGGRA